MARARNLKPGLFTNEYLGTCDLMEVVLFEGLWTLADRFGRLENRPLRIKAQIFPYRNYTAQEITGAIQNLSSNGFLTLYTVNGQDYIEVCNFEKHQNPHKNEKGGEIPPPPQPPENKGTLERSSNYSTDPVMQQSDPDESCIRNHESCMDESLQEGSTPFGDSPSANDPIQDDEVIRSFPTKAGDFHSIDESFVSELKNSFPHLDVEQQLKQARTWLVANPSRAKTARGMPRFLNGWMSNQRPSAQVHRIGGTQRPPVNQDSEARKQELDRLLHGQGVVYDQ